jgi:peptide deformylase
MAIDLPIAKLGHPILRQIAKTVDNVGAVETQRLIDDMLQTVATHKGMGIAAPQVHHGKRIFIMCSQSNARYPDAPLMAATAMINPQLVDHSLQWEKNWEGCLSVPGLRGLVARYNTIEVSYCDRYGVEHQVTFSGFLARVFQHELDHLDGLTFIDRLESTKDLYSESEWYRQFID